MVISLAIYGDRSEYLYGTRCCCLRIPRYYPGSTILLSHDDTVPRKALDEFEALGAVLVDQTSLGLVGPQRMLWRYLCWDKFEGPILSRDVDSSVSARECHAVEQWLASGMLMHSMHDSVSHEGLMGGMVGVLGGRHWGWVHESIMQWCKQYPDPMQNGHDQSWLNAMVKPHCIDSIFTSGGKGHPFVIGPDLDLGHVGASMVMLP